MTVTTRDRSGAGYVLLGFGTVLLALAVAMFVAQLPATAGQPPDQQLWISFCHWDNGHGGEWHHLTTADDGTGIPVGHGGHSNDMIPGQYSEYLGRDATEADIEATCGAPTLTLVKTWVGTPWPGFGLTVTPDGGSPMVATSGVALTLTSGEYRAAETGMPLSGYVAGSWGGDCSADGSIRLSDGDHAVCTITNSQLPSLTVVKTWDGDPWPGFGLTVTASGGTPVAVTSGVATTVAPGSFTVAEVGMPASGYQASPWGGDCAVDGTITLSYGQHATCTITNTEEEAPPSATLTVVKTWNGDPWAGFGLQVTPDGGSPVAMTSGVPVVLDPGDYQVGEIGAPATGYDIGAWGGDCAADGTITLADGDNATCTITNRELPTLTVTKTWVGASGSVSITATPSGGTPVAVTPGVPVILQPGAHLVAEAPLDGYTASTWGGACGSDGSITLSYGQHATCTITNTEEGEPPAATLTVVKTWEGQPWAGFGLIATPGAGAPWSITAGTPVVVDPGSYTLSEVGMPLVGYQAGAWGGDCAAGGTITLLDGDNATCTITNYELPTLTLVKSWQGEPWPGFGLTVTPAGGGAIPATSGIAVIVSAGSASAVEVGMPPAGYEAGAWGGACAADGTVALGYGEHLTCTITNYELPTLTVVKTWDGDPWPGFAITVTPDGGGAVVAMTSGVPATLLPGDYDLAEVNMPVVGYTAGPWGGDCSADGSVTLGYGDDLTCTITNTENETGGPSTTGGTIPPPPDELPRTGDGMLIPSLLAGIALILMGCGVMLLGRSRRVVTPA